MRVITSGPSGIIFTLASNAGRGEILRTARRILREKGLPYGGAMELDCFVHGTHALVFARCRRGSMFRFDSMTEAYDAARSCRSVPAQLYRYRGYYYIEADTGSGLDGLAKAAEPAERHLVLAQGDFLADDVIAGIKAGVS